MQGDHIVADAEQRSIPLAIETSNVYCAACNTAYVAAACTIACIYVQSSTSAASHANHALSVGCINLIEVVAHSQHERDWGTTIAAIVLHY
jgi:hypothetical protein